MKKYIQVYLNHNHPDDIPVIIKEIQETVSPVTVKDGHVCVEFSSDNDLMNKAYALGLLNERISEDYTIHNPYLLELKHAEEKSNV